MPENIAQVQEQDIEHKSIFYKLLPKVNLQIGVFEQRKEDKINPSHKKTPLTKQVKSQPHYKLT